MEWNSVSVRCEEHTKVKESELIPTEDDTKSKANSCVQKLKNLAFKTAF